MDWDSYYEKFYDWSTSTQIKKMSSLTLFGVSAKVTEVAQEYMNKKAASWPIKKRLSTLIAELSSVGISYCRNGRGTTLPGLISLPFWGKDGEAILYRMDLMGISISTGAACV